MQYSEIVPYNKLMCSKNEIAENGRIIIVEKQPLTRLYIIDQAGAALDFLTNDYWGQRVSQCFEYLIRAACWALW